MASIVDLVRRPSSFLADAAQEASLTGPALVAASLGALGVARTFVFLRAFEAVTAGMWGSSIVYAIGQLNVSAPWRLVAASLGALLQFFVAWALVTILVYGASRLFVDGGSIRTLFALVGWGQVPTLLPAVCSTAFITVAVAGAPDLATEAAVASWARETFQQSPVFHAINVVTLLAAVWSVGLWVLAAETALDLTRKQAVACVALPGAVVLLDAASDVVALFFV